MADNGEIVAKSIMTGAGVGLAASLISIGEGMPQPDHSNTVDQVAITTAVDKAFKNKPDVTKIPDPKEFAEAERKWIESIAKNTLEAKAIEQNARDNTENIKSSNGNKMIFNTMGGAVAGGAGASLFMAGVNGWRNRQEKKKAEAAAQDGNDQGRS